MSDALGVECGRSEPIHSFSWGAETLLTCAWNPAEVRVACNRVCYVLVILLWGNRSVAVRSLLLARGRAAWTAGKLGD